MKNPTKVTFSIRFIALLFVASLLPACSSTSPGIEATQTPGASQALTTVKVQRGDITVVANLFGRIAALSEQNVNFLRDGTVRNVYVQVGDEVSAGQLLADLRVDELEAELAKTRQEAADEELRAYNRIRRAEIDVEIARLRLEGLQAENRPVHEQQIQALQLELAEMNLAEVKSNPDLIPAGARVKELEAAIEAAALYSPVNGTVISAVTPGRSIKTTAPAFVIGDISSLEASVTGEEDILETLSEGLTVTAILEKFPDQVLSGTIRQLPYPLGSGDASNSASVRITLDSSPEVGEYQLGDKITVKVILADAKGILWLPPAAVRNIGGRVFVMVPEGNTLRRVEVTTGLEIYERVEIKSGLEEGQVVVIP